MEKDKIVIVGANDFQKQLVLKAKELGYETHVFAWEDGAVAKDDADKFYPVSITDKEKILEISKDINPKGVISIASDLAVPTVNYVANKLNLVANSDYSSLISTNKFEMRKKLLENGAPCPKFKLINKEFNLKNLDMELPVIVKPIDRSGSRGIYKIERIEDLKNAIEGALSVSFHNEVLIEEFVEGKEYSIEMISYKGQHRFLALTEKFTTGAPQFIETAHMEPGRIDETIKDKLIITIKGALDALEIQYGASHSEFKIDKNNNIKIIEIGARMGGDCIGSDLVEISTGYDFKKMVIETSTGKEPDFNIEGKDKKTAFIKFIFTEEDLNLLKEIQQNNLDKIYRVSEIEEVGTRIVTDSSNRCGYFILKCDSQEECLNLAKFV